MKIAVNGVNDLSVMNGVNVLVVGEYSYFVEFLNVEDQSVDGEMDKWMVEVLMNHYHHLNT